VRFRKPTGLGFASGAIAGLVAITPACGFVNTLAAIWIGIAAAFVSFYAILLKTKLGRYDDSLDVFAVHGCAGMLGLLATGLFADAAINPAIIHGMNGSAGILAGGSSLRQLGIQALAVAVTVALAVPMTALFARVSGALTGGLRATGDEEEDGLDVTEHGEVGYTGDAAGSAAFAAN
jgi:Amt family ammonium transporter